MHEMWRIIMRISHKCLYTFMVKVDNGQRQRRFMFKECHFHYNLFWWVGYIKLRNLVVKLGWNGKAIVVIISKIIISSMAIVTTLTTNWKNQREPHYYPTAVYQPRTFLLYLWKGILGLVGHQYPKGWIHAVLLNEAATSHGGRDLHLVQGQNPGGHCILEWLLLHISEH